MTVVFFAWLYLPIVAVVLFSFNDKKSLSSFAGFSLRWYDDFFHDGALLDSLVASLQDRPVAAVGSLVLGTMLALGLERVRSRRGRVVGAVTLLPLVTPEIVTGVAALLFFTGIGLKLSLVTVMLAEITFSIAYVTVIVRGRLAGIAPRSRRRRATSAARRGRRCAWSPCRRWSRRCSAPGCWSSRWSSTTSCSPSSPPASTRSRCRCGSTPRSASVSRPPSTRSAR